MSTDFREYSAAFHDHQNDLMHYGVKGMKWHKRKTGLKTVSAPTANMRFANTIENKKGNEEAAHMYNRLAGYSNKQLERIAKNEGARNDEGKHINLNVADIAENTLANRSAGIVKRRKDGSGVTDAVNKAIEQKKKKSLTGVAKKYTAKELEKKRNKKLINARKAERAYRRGGH